MLARLLELDAEEIGAELASILMDDKITTYNVCEHLAEAYDRGCDCFKRGMDEALMSLINMNMEELVSHMEKEIEHK